MPLRPRPSRLTVHAADRTRTYRSLFIGAPIVLSLVASGCGTKPQTAAPPPPARASIAPAARSRPVNLAVDRPNELGRVPILEYHQIAPKEERWARTPQSFRKDLDRLYRLGYRPVALMDYVHGNIDLPPGKSPVVLTFDDSDAGQFRYLGSGPSAGIDPDCAVGIMQAFSKAHPDFPARATFYVLPSLFGQPAFGARKLRELKAWGFEIGNHTFTHAMLRRLSRDAGLNELAKGVGVTEKILPGYDVQSVALPNGSIPHDDSILHGGTADGITYRHEAALLVGAEPAPSPFSKRFKPFRLPRIQATEMAKPSITDWLNTLEKHPADKYRSDADPRAITFPRQVEDRLNPAAARGRSIRAY